MRLSLVLGSHCQDSLFLTWWYTFLHSTLLPIQLPGAVCLLVLGQWGRHAGLEDWLATEVIPATCLCSSPHPWRGSCRGGRPQGSLHVSGPVVSPFLPDRLGSEAHRRSELKGPCMAMELGAGSGGEP